MNTGIKKSNLVVTIISWTVVFVLLGLLAWRFFAYKDKKIPVKVLILPKFEVDGITDDFPGEAQYFYDEYLAGGKEYEIQGSAGPSKLYYKDGVAMYLIGQGKVNAAVNTSAVLSDERFDFSDSYILSVGCAGTSEGYGIFGDVYVISAAVDFDLGHHADPREMETDNDTTWFHDASFDESAFVKLDPELTEKVFSRVKDIPLDTTEKTTAFLNKQYPGESWAERSPRVQRGTSVTSDNYWKGIHGHNNAVLICDTYGCTDPYAVAEMEDIAVAMTVKSFGLADRLIILRSAVNMDVFPDGVTPEMLWGDKEGNHIASEESLESVDIFETAMNNCFKVGKPLIDDILAGRF